MVGLGDENGDAFGPGGIEQLPIQLEVRTNRFKVSFDFGYAIRFDIENGSQEKCFDIFCSVLLEVNNVCSGFGENLCRAGDKPFLVGTMDMKYITSHRHAIILKKLGLVTNNFVFL